MIFTNPPFGAKVEVDVEIARRYKLNSNAPEILFIEACYNFLKPGGKMGIVLPDGILGNPNTESVRKWILGHFKLLASVDLPVETFLPQVGVQASLLFLQKKTAEELLIPLDKEDYDVFMAIVEQVGKDRRGVPIYKKDEDGAEILFAHEKKWLALPIMDVKSYAVVVNASNTWQTICPKWLRLMLNLWRSISNENWSHT